MCAILLKLVVTALVANHGFAHKITKDEIETKQCYDRICWGETDYPEREISSLLQENDYNLKMFGNYVEDADDSASLPQSCNLCSHIISKRVLPLTLHDQDDSEYFVVRTENYQQSITLNICESEDVQKKESRCMKPASEKPFGEERECSQKSTTIRLLVYNPKENKFEAKTLQYPSACICTIQKADTDVKRSNN